MTKTTAIVFFGTIAIGVVASIVYFNYFAKPVEVPNEKLPAAEEPASKPGKAPQEKPAKTRPAKDPAKPVESPVAGSLKGVFSSPQEAMSALTDAVGKKDFGVFREFVGAEAIPKSIEAQVKALIEDPKLAISKKRPFSEISKSANSVRWALNFEPIKPGPSSELYADLADTGDSSFKISQIRLPYTAPEASGSTPESEAVETPDALTVAHAFSRAIVGRDFKVARALSDPTTVTDERVAALMIAVEEGKFRLREERPLVVTLSRENITWVLSRVQSETGASEFALELGQMGGNWKVNGLTFSKVLSALADQAGGGSVAYSPIVEDPSGGDSLVLYFEFDEPDLTSRGNRQLAIVADILSQDDDRVIRINGHADAMGSDQYNATLSNGRAESIRNALISMGVAPKQVITEGFGETKPRRPNFNPDGTDNPTGRSENRRAEVYLDF